MVYYVVGYFQKPILAESMNLEMIKKDHHITLYPGFELEPEYTPDLFQLINKIAKEHGHIPVAIKGDATFYSKTLNEEFPVKLVEQNDTLTKIHYQVDELLKARGGEAVNQAFTREKYTPHISHFDDSIDLKLKYIGISRSIIKDGANEIRNIGRFPLTQED